MLITLGTNLEVAIGGRRLTRLLQFMKESKEVSWKSCIIIAEKISEPASGAKKPNESQKSKSLLGDEGSQRQGKGFL